MEANNLKISADLASYIKSVVDSSIAINNNASAIPTYSMYSYSAMSTSSVDTGAISIGGQDIVDYCEELRIDVNALDGNKAEKTALKDYALKSDYTDTTNMKSYITGQLENYAKSETLNDYAKSEVLNDYTLKENYTDTEAMKSYITEQLDPYVK